MVPVCHLGTSVFFTVMQSSAGSSSIQVGSRLSNSQRAKFPILGISYAEVSSSSPHSLSLRLRWGFPTLYIEGLCHWQVCSKILRLSLEICWLETRRREKKQEKGTLGIEKAGKVSATVGCFLGFFMEQAFLFGEKKSIIITLLIVC